MLILAPGAVAGWGWIASGGAGARAAAPPAFQTRRIDPAAWGADHAGLALPEFSTGEECLFCHRSDVGPGWRSNPHGQSVRFARADPEMTRALERTPGVAQFFEDAKYAIGRMTRRRFLRDGGAPGRFDLGSVQWTPPAEGGGGAFTNAEDPRWEEDRFTRDCAGCHAGPVQTDLMATVTLSIDCFSCHGAADLEHASDPSRVMFGAGHGAPARAITSACAQCHLRGGRSRSTGRPYPNQFVPGDNLFRDYVVDFSGEHLASLNPGDRHVYENVREVVIGGNDRVTCVTCHEVHRASSAVHTSISERATVTCATCHPAGRPRSDPLRYAVHSRVCEY